MSQAIPQLDIPTLRKILSDSPSSHIINCKDVPNLQNYDYSVPHRFSPAQRKKICEFGQQSVRNFSNKISDILRVIFSVELKSIAEEYTKQDAEPLNGYAVLLSDNHKPVGYITFPIETADGMVVKMLGGISEGSYTDTLEGRKLSSLEQALLLDMARCIIEALSSASREFGGGVFDEPTHISPVVPSLVEGAKTAEFTRMRFHHAGDENKFPFTIVLLSDEVEPIAGMKKRQNLLPEESQELMLGHFLDVPLNVRGQLDEISVKLQDVAQLEVGDVLMLNKKPNEPIDIIAAEKVVMRGMPVSYQNKYSLWVKQLQS